MSSHPPIQSHQTRTRLTSAAPPLFNLNDFLQSLPTTALPAPDPMPKCANARQTVPISEFSQNEPTLAPPPTIPPSLNTQNSARLSSTLRLRPEGSSPKSALSTSPALSARQNVPTGAKARQQITDFGKSNPPRPPHTNHSKRPPRPLTANQLLAATLLVAGRTTSAIAAELQINRHTLARWKRSIPFQNELRFQINARLAQRKTVGGRQ